MPTIASPTTLSRRISSGCPCNGPRMITASAHTAAEVEQASARILMLTGDMTAMEVFEPNELRRHAITISEEAAKLRPLHATNPNLRPTDQTNLKHAVSVVESAHKLVSSSMAIRKTTYTHTKNLLELAVEIEGLGELFRKLRATIEHLS